MSLALKLWSILFILCIIIMIIYLLKKDRISVKYSLVWLLPSLCLLVFIIIPGAIIGITKLLGFQTGSNMIFALLIGLLMIISLALTVIVSGQKRMIRILIQEISILKEKK